jgi:uncharacterized membrane protein YgdD (TMEM256/DUF423 family)
VNHLLRVLPPDTIAGVVVAIDTLPGADLASLSVEVANRMLFITQVSVGVTFLSVVVGAFAARAALKTAEVAAATLDVQSAANAHLMAHTRAERRSAYFRALIADCALDTVPLFRVQAVELITGCCGQLANLTGENRKGEFESIAENTIRRFNQLYGALEDDLLARASAWDDGAFRQELTNSLTEMQDEITTLLSLAVAHEDKAREAIVSIGRWCPIILGVVVHADLRQFDAT